MFLSIITLILKSYKIVFLFNIDTITQTELDTFESIQRNLFPTEQRMETTTNKYIIWAIYGPIRGGGVNARVTTINTYSVERSI